MNDQGGDAPSRCGVHDHTYYDNVHDDDAPYGKSSKDSGSDANSSDPNTGMDQCNGKDATNVDSIPNSMANANIPKRGPRTNRRSLDDRYIQAR